GGNHLAEEGLPDPLDLAAAGALQARDRAGAGLGAGGLAGLAGHGRSDLDRLPRSEHRLVELEVDHDLEVCTPRRAAGPAATATEGAAAAEERLEDVVDPARAEAGGSARADALGAEAVVALPLLGVREHLVGLSDLLEALSGLRIRVRVGVQLTGEAAVRLLDLVGGRVR